MAITNDDELVRVAERAWALQANHQRFAFRPRRADDDPSRVVWVRANQVWQDQARARKRGSRRVLAAS